MGSVEKALPSLMRKRGCKGTNKRGEPCSSSSVDSSGYCAAHRGGSDAMRELGRKGGRQSVRSRLGLDDEVADANLIRLGKRRLEQLVNSDNEGVALRAATALYSYRAQQPPSEPVIDPDYQPGTMPNGKPVSIAAVFECAVFDAKGLIDDEFATIILRAAAKVRRLEAEGKVAPTFVDEELEAEQIADEVFTEAGTLKPEELAELDRWRAGDEA